MKNIFNSSKIIFVCLLVCHSNFAQTLSDNNKKFVAFQQESFAITNVMLVDGKGTAPQSSMTIIVKNGKIIDIGASSKLPVP